MEVRPASQPNIYHSVDAAEPSCRHLNRLAARFPPGHLYPDESRLAAIQEWNGTRYLIIDEKSMIGYKAMAAIDARLRLIFPHRSYRPFGGLSVLLVGDFWQLPPVAGTPLYATSVLTGEHEHGREVHTGRDLYPPPDQLVTATVIPFS